MAARLPIPGGDDNTWGDILNAYLEVSLATDGSLNPGVIGTAQLQNNCVTNAQLDIPTQTAIDAVASKYVKPAGGIPSSDLSSSVQANLALASASVQSVNNTPPLGGNVTLKVADLNDASAASGASNNQVLAYNSGTSQWVPATVSNTPVNNATGSTPGIVQLSGDLGGGSAGTATDPQVTSTHLTSALPVNQGGTGSTSQNFVDLTTGQSIGGNKTLTGTTTTDSLTTTNLQVTGGTPASGKVLTSDSSGNATWATPSAGSSTLASDTDVAISSPTNLQVLAYDSTTSKWQNQTALAASNATSSSPGLIQLDGDLGGTATSPTVPTKVSKSGDTMTGELLLPGNPADALGATPKQYVDAETTRAEAAEALLAPLASPAFTGTPTVNSVPLGGSIDGGNATSSATSTIDGGNA